MQTDRIFNLHANLRCVIASIEALGPTDALLEGKALLAEMILDGDFDNDGLTLEEYMDDGTYQIRPR